MKTSKANRRRLSAAALMLVSGLLVTGCAVGGDSTAAVPSTTTAAVSTLAADSADASTTNETISSTSAAAQAFLATLSDEQREAVLYDYDDETKTTSWTNFPVTFVQRAGLNLNDLTEDQRAAAMEVLQALLDEEGYSTVTGIIGGDQYLLENSSSTETSLGQYYIAFFGDPDGTSAYEVQFGGHHLGINATLDPTTEQITFAPTHLGVQPAVYTDAEGNEVQPFDGIYTDAFAFFDSLDEEQQATLTSGEVSMCAPGGTCDFATGAGLSGADLDDEQRQLMLELIANWAGMADAQSTADALAKIEATLDDTVIAWSGETAYDMSTGNGISFSISGPNVYVAFQAQQGSAGADVDGVTTSGWGHVHTIYRDPSNDYANSVTQQEGSGMGGGPGGNGTMPSGGPGGAGGTPPGAPGSDS